MGMPSGTATLEDSWLLSYEIEHTLIVQSDNCSPLYLPKINETYPLKDLLTRDFPGGPEPRTLCSQCRGPRFDPWSGNYIPHAATKSSHATT